MTAPDFTVALPNVIEIPGYVAPPGYVDPSGRELIASPLFPTPFFTGHCIVMSFAHLKRDPSPQFASDLANKAYAIRRPLRDPREEIDKLWGHDVHRLLDPKDGGGYAHYPEDVRAWLELSGLRQIERRDWAPRGTGPSLRSFARTHPEGRWFIGIPGHAVALIDGKLYGAEDFQLPWSVRVAIRVEEIAQ